MAKCVLTHIYKFTKIAWDREGAKDSYKGQFITITVSVQYDATQSLFWDEHILFFVGFYHACNNWCEASTLEIDLHKNEVLDHMHNCIVPNCRDQHLG